MRTVAASENKVWQGIAKKNDKKNAFSVLACVLLLVRENENGKNVKKLVQANF